MKMTRRMLRYDATDITSTFADTFRFAKVQRFGFLIMIKKHHFPTYSNLITKVM